MTFHEALDVFTFGYVAGGVVVGAAAYKVATHLGELRSQVAGVAGHVAGAQAASVVTRALTLPAAVVAELAPAAAPAAAAAAAPTPTSPSA